MLYEYACWWYRDGTSAQTIVYAEDERAAKLIVRRNHHVPGWSEVYAEIVGFAKPCGAGHVWSLGEVKSYPGPKKMTKEKEVV